MNINKFFHVQSYVNSHDNAEFFAVNERTRTITMYLVALLLMSGIIIWGIALMEDDFKLFVSGCFVIISIFLFAMVSDIHPVISVLKWIANLIWNSKIDSEIKAAKKSAAEDLYELREDIKDMKQSGGDEWRSTAEKAERILKANYYSV